MSAKGGDGRRGGRPQRPDRSAPDRSPGKRSSSGRSQSAGARGGRSKTGRTQGAPARRPATGGLGGDQVEGRQAVRELLVAGRRRVYEVVLSTDRKDAPVLDDILELSRQLQVPVREVGRARLSSLARTDGHQGVLARAAPLRETEFEELLSGPGPAPFLLAADGLTDPGNLGALLRTAECAGVTGIVLPRHRAVHVSPAVTKTAAGAIEHLRFAVVGGLPTALATAGDAGVLVVGLDMGGTHSVFDLPSLDRPVIIVVGAEGRGLGRLVSQRCDVIAAVPMAGQTESLNVSVAGALALYEVVRQRSV